MAKQSQLDQAVRAIDGFKHWTLKTLNRSGFRRAYECTIWGDGKRVSASAKSPTEAISRAIEKLNLTRTERREIEQQEQQRRTRLARGGLQVFTAE